MFEEALQIAVRRREAKGKREKERYTHLNGEFQRIARRDKKAFLGEQCKEIEDNNRMGKTKNLFKKVRNTKGSLLADTLVCEVKCTLESIIMSKASGGDRIPAKLFQILKDNAVKVLHLIWQHIWKTQQWS